MAVILVLTILIVAAGAACGLGVMLWRMLRRADLSPRKEVL